MEKRKLALLVSFGFLWFAALSCAQVAPKVTLNREKVPHHGHVEVRGTGFTPKRNISSHLRRPDGTEFPVLPFLTDERGEFFHDIDTLLLGHGVFELWVVDDTSKATSNRVRFEVTLEQEPAK